MLEPDTAVTHIIYEGRAPAALARELGLSSIEDLPEGCVCVKWEWVANCKLQVRILGPLPIAGNRVRMSTDGTVLQAGHGTLPIIRQKGFRKCCGDCGAE